MLKERIIVATLGIGLISLGVVICFTALPHMLGVSLVSIMVGIYLVATCLIPECKHIKSSGKFSKKA